MRLSIKSYGLVFLSLIGILLGSGGCFLNEIYEDLDRMVEQTLKGSRTILVYDGRYFVEWDEPLWVEPESDYKSPLEKPYYQSFDSWLASSRPIAELREELIVRKREELTVQKDDVPVVCLIISPIKEMDEEEIGEVRLIMEECGYVAGISSGTLKAHPAWWND